MVSELHRSFPRNFSTSATHANTNPGFSAAALTSMSGVPKRWGQHGGVGSLARRIPFVTKEGSVQRLWLCRHGQTAANQHHLIQGSGIDLPLNTVGQQQALKLGEALASFRFDVIASSDLIRAKASPVSSLSHLHPTPSSLLPRVPSQETATALASYHPQTYYGMIDEGLREMNFGALEGQRIADVSEERAAIEGRWDQGELSLCWPGEGGESPSGVAARGVRALLELLDADAEPSNVAVVAHGRCNKYCLAALLCAPSAPLHPAATALLRVHS